MNRRSFFKRTVGTLTAAAVFGHGIKADATEAVVGRPEMFEVGDLVQVPRTRECVLITAIDNGKITFTKGFGNTKRSEIRDDDPIIVIGNIERGSEGAARSIDKWLERKIRPRVFEGKELTRGKERY